MAAISRFRCASCTRYAAQRRSTIRLTASDSARSRSSRSWSAATRGSAAAVGVARHGCAAIAAHATKKTRVAQTRAYSRAVWLVIEAPLTAALGLEVVAVMLAVARAVDRHYVRCRSDVHHAWRLRGGGGR